MKQEVEVRAISSWGSGAIGGGLDQSSEKYRARIDRDEQLVKLQARSRDDMRREGYWNLA